MIGAGRLMLVILTTGGSNKSLEKTGMADKHNRKLKYELRHNWLNSLILPYLPCNIVAVRAKAEQQTKEKEK